MINDGLEFLGMTSFRMNFYYILLYKILFNLIITGIIPLLLLSCFNCHIYSYVKENERFYISVSQSYALFAIIVVFITCNILRPIILGYDCYNSSLDYDHRSLPEAVRLLIVVSQILTAVSCSTTGLIYLLVRPNFRSELWRLLR